MAVIAAFRWPKDGSKVLAAALLLPLAAAGCTEKKAEPEAPVLRPVRYEVVSASAAGAARTFAGQARAGLETTLSFKVGGTVAELTARVGDSVAQGGVIARLDPKDLELKVKEAEAARPRAAAEARNATGAYERVRGLYENQNASLSDLDRARASDESARAQVRSTRNQLELARRQRSYAVLTAPEQCRVAATYVDESENVASGQRVALITCGKELEVRVTVPEAVIARIRAGAPATVRCDALPRRSFRGRVTEVGVAATGDTPAYPVTVGLSETDPAIRPGMACEAEVALGGEGDEIRVAPSAVAEDRQGPFVFVLEPAEDGPDAGTGTVHRRAVVPGDLSTLGLAVTDGLSDGEWVVTAGVSRLTDGQRVRVPDLP
jgi:multidrug efflux system membrane fusion protein